MATRNISLTDQLDSFVEQTVQSGDFQNASEVVRAGLRLLKSEREAHQRKLERLRAAIQVGVDQYERGEYEEVDDIDAWMKGVREEADRGDPSS